MDADRRHLVALGTDGRPHTAAAAATLAGTRPGQCQPSSANRPCSPRANYS